MGSAESHKTGRKETPAIASVSSTCEPAAEADEKGESEIIKAYLEAGEKGNAIGYFNAGNCFMFGTMGVEVNWWKGMEMWKKGTELVEKRRGKGLERWAEESNEKEACGEELDLSSLLKDCAYVLYISGQGHESRRRTINVIRIGDDGVRYLACALERNSTLTKLRLSCLAASVVQGMQRV